MRRKKQQTPGQVAKELYDLLAGTLLAGTLVLALLAWVLHLVAEGLAALFGGDLPSAWELAGSALGVDPSWVRLILFATIEAAILVPAYQPLRRLGARLEAEASRLWKKIGKIRSPAVRQGLGVLFTVVTTALLIAFLLQPTLVPLHIDRRAWLDRAANLVDGSASASIVDSVVGLARRFYAEPVHSTEVVDPISFDADLAADTIPLMDRWDPYLLEAAGGDRELYAKTKAFMWVESGGRQFAISSTGCAGLMQFCASTAQRRPFSAIFGVGQVAACGCDDCSVPREIQIALESDPGAAVANSAIFPCNLADARFDAERSIQAGVAFVRELSGQVGGHLPLMYVGYNAGPGVSTSLYRTLGEQDEVTVDELRPHLAGALRPYHGTRAEPRANGLLEVHLPKLMAAYERWRP